MIDIRGIGEVVSFILVLLILLLTGCTDSSDTGIDFIFTDLDGNERHFNEFHGKVIVLDLMGVECTYCFPQMLELKKIAENYSSEEVTIMSIDVWVIRGETAEYLQSYIDYFRTELDVELDWVFGLDDEEGSLLYEYANQGVPTLYIFDKNGNIYYPHVGLVDYSTLVSKIDELLS